MMPEKIDKVISTNTPISTPLNRARCQLRLTCEKLQDAKRNKVDYLDVIKLEYEGVNAILKAFGYNNYPNAQIGLETINVKHRSGRLLSFPELKWLYIKTVIEYYKGNISESARAIGMHRRSVQRVKNKRWNI